jgi:PAS domain S-box-containing protein
VGESGEREFWAPLFQAAFDASANPMLLLEPDRTIVVANQACVDAFGYARGDLVGRLGDFFIEPGSRRQIDRDWNVLRETGRVEGDRKILTAEGHQVVVHFAAHRGTVTGRELVLWVVLPSDSRPLEQTRLQSAGRGQLTARELEVVSEIAMGRRAHEIADRLFISPTTVQTHVRNAMEKLGARSQAQLVAIALSERHLDPSRVPREARNPEI